MQGDSDSFQLSLMSRVTHIFMCVQCLSVSEQLLIVGFISRNEFTKLNYKFIAAAIHFVLHLSIPQTLRDNWTGLF